MFEDYSSRRVAGGASLGADDHTTNGLACGGGGRSNGACVPSLRCSRGASCGACSIGARSRSDCLATLATSWRGTRALVGGLAGAGEIRTAVRSPPDGFGAPPSRVTTATTTARDDDTSTATFTARPSCVGPLPASEGGCVSTIGCAGSPATAGGAAHGRSPPVVRAGARVTIALSLTFGLALRIRSRGCWSRWPSRGASREVHAVARHCHAAHRGVGSRPCSRWLVASAVPVAIPAAILVAIALAMCARSRSDPGRGHLRDGDRHHDGGRLRSRSRCPSRCPSRRGSVRAGAGSRGGGTRPLPVNR
jgi:hypothetical protein